ncbi:MAG: UbiA family prenyltransferase [Bacteroidota bacterium]
MLSTIIRTLRLIRWPNLLVVALTQLLIVYRVLLPAFQSAEVNPVCSTWKVVELILITLSISASGYIINDLRDAEIDAINRPGTNQVELLGRDFVQWLYALCVLAGFLFSLLVAFRLKELELLWIYPMTVALLTLYSLYLKRAPFVGNLLVALYCAGVPGILFLAERASIYELLERQPQTGIDLIRTGLLFMVFAFLANLLRELVKDVEDREGDQAAACRTLPIIWSPAKVKGLGMLYILLLGVALLIPYAFRWEFFQHPLTIAYIVLLLFGLVAIGFFWQWANSSSDFHRLSQLLKLYLLLGLGLLFCFN